MDIYILDSLFKRDEVVDDYISLVWTERYNSLGDFELKVKSSIVMRGRFKLGTFLGIDQSMRVMIVESVERAYEDDNGWVLNVKGSSLEKLLTKRVAISSWSKKPGETWYFRDKPETIAGYAVRSCVRDNPVRWQDVFMNLDISEEVGDYNVAAFQDTITYNSEQPETVYEVVQKISENFDFGFSLTRKGETGRLLYRSYNGVDRTREQSVYPRIMFSNDLESLEHTTQFASNADEYNVAYVITPVGNLDVVPDMVDPGITGFDRKVLPVLADDITDTDPAVAKNKMIIAGKAALLEHQSYRGFDGQVRKENPWVYGKDYNMGDIVEMRDEDGYVNRVRVTEQIFSSDKNGVKSYPTLSVRTLAIPGSWLLWNIGKVWADLTTQEWSSI